MPSFIQIQATNSDTPDEQEIWRYDDGQTTADAIRIARGLPPNFTFQHFNVQSGKTYWFFIRAITSGLSTDSTPDDAVVTLDQLYVHVVDREGTLDDALGSVVSLVQTDQSLTCTQQSGIYNLKGRPKPFKVYGGISQKVLSTTCYISRGDIGTYNNLVSAYEAQSVVCVRDQIGNLLFGKIDQLTTKEDGPRFDVSFSVQETSYNEEI